MIEQEELKDENGLTLKEYLKQYDPDRYPKPAVTADACIFTEKGILMVKRKGHPCIRHWALPGGYANQNEPVEETAKRELWEETGVVTDDMKLVGVYSKPHRDPRDWIITAAFKKVLKAEEIDPKAGDDAAETGWFLPIVENGILTLKGEGLTLSEEDIAFDHADIIKDAMKV